ncbi:hypothetical protein, partial [Klebsiella pneumoniae]|uniref:hypothetical protein n=1 Tax=Klebsiella pneumoniae TaxID=573 RepID=UPI0037132CA7
AKTAGWEKTRAAVLSAIVMSVSLPRKLTKHYLCFCLILSRDAEIVDLVLREAAASAWQVIQGWQMK